MSNLIGNPEDRFSHDGANMIHERSRDTRKLVFGVSDQVSHKPACADTEDGYKLEISDLRRRVVLFV